MFMNRMKCMVPTAVFLLVAGSHISAESSLVGSEDGDTKRVTSVVSKQNLSTFQHGQVKMIPIAVAPTVFDKESNSVKVVATTHIAGEDDHIYWEGKKESCKFCRYMLEGPCERAFKSWDICVQKARLSDHCVDQKCASVSSAMRMCVVSLFLLMKHYTQ